MKIDSSPTGRDLPDGAAMRAAAVARRGIGLALALLGLAVLVAAQSTPWVSVRLDGITRVLRGQDTEQTTYHLADLPGAQAPLYIGGVLLFGVFAAAWVKPDWRRFLLRAAIALDIVLVFLILDLGQTAVKVSGYPPSDYPKSELLSGSALALVGLVMVTGAVAALAAPVREQSAAPRDVEPVSPSGSSGGVGWSARPVWVPWWRRPGPLIALVCGVVAMVLMSVAVLWLALDRAALPRDQPRDLRQLLVSAPAGSTPWPAGTGGQLTLGQVVDLSGDARPEALVFQLLAVNRAAVGGWTESDGTTVVIALMQFDSEGAAASFLDAYGSRTKQRVGDGNVAGIPGLPGGQSFVDPLGGGDDGFPIQTLAQRGDIVVLVLEAQPAAVGLAHINALVVDQYDQLGSSSAGGIRGERPR
ncbi:MAG TPA: hypothetical protein VFX60_18440 [Micromonospora sp.]|nr:hypothetical protein [Micromonospora sp.]